MFPLDVQKQAPWYEFAFDTLDPPTYNYYDTNRNVHVFVVEQGRRFYMKFNLTAYPRPHHADLHKDGELVQSTSRGTIFVGVDSIGVQLVDKMSYAGRYTISCANEMGSGKITFQIDVQRKLTYDLKKVLIITKHWYHHSCRN